MSEIEQQKIEFFVQNWTRDLPINTASMVEILSRCNEFDKMKTTARQLNKISFGTMPGGQVRNDEFVTDWQLPALPAAAERRLIPFAFETTSFSPVLQLPEQAARSTQLRNTRQMRWQIKPGR